MKDTSMHAIVALVLVYPASMLLLLYMPLRLTVKLVCPVFIWMV